LNEALEKEEEIGQEGREKWKILARERELEIKEHERLHCHSG
jgi:hypothetical protein